MIETIRGLAYLMTTTGGSFSLARETSLLLSPSENPELLNEVFLLRIEGGLVDLRRGEYTAVLIVRTDI
mgnify:CR=1 FL=1